MVRNLSFGGGGLENYNRVIASSLSPLTETPESPNRLPACSIYHWLFFSFGLIRLILPSLDVFLKSSWVEKQVMINIAHGVQWRLCSLKSLTEYLWQHNQKSTFDMHTDRQTWLNHDGLWWPFLFWTEIPLLRLCLLYNSLLKVDKG